MGTSTRCFVIKSGEVTEEEIIHFCEAKLAKYKVPKKACFLEELPRNASKKLLRRELRQLVEGDVSGDKKATFHITEMPLVIPLLQAHGTYEKRESIVIELEDTDGCIGFGEVVAFSGTVVYGRNR